MLLARQRDNHWASATDYRGIPLRRGRAEPPRGTLAPIPVQLDKRLSRRPRRNSGDLRSNLSLLPYGRKPLFREPRKSGKVMDLADSASVSFGHASNVRTAVLNRDGGTQDSEGGHRRTPDETLGSPRTCLPLAAFWKIL